jgi:SAM-dependent methyltransferase
LRLLDAGCGDGNNIAALRTILAERGYDAIVVGSDYNELRLARASARTQALPLKSDLLQLPFPDRAFDLVLCNHVIEHIPADVDAMRELARVLDNDGLLLLGVPNEGCALARLRNNVLQRSILRTTDHVNFYTGKALTARMRTAGLAPLEPPMREGFFLPHLGLMLRLREMHAGRRLLAALAALLPSQSAGLLVAAKPAAGSGPAPADI